MSFKGKTKQDVVAEFRHAEILDAARKIFAARGFHDAAVEDIAKAAGLAKGTVYLYYSSKRDLYWAALGDGLVELTERLNQTVTHAETTEAKIRAFIETKIAYFEENRDFFAIYHAEFSHLIAHPTYFHEDFRNLFLQQIDLLKAVLQSAVDSNEIRNLPVQPAAFAIYDLTRGAITHRILGWSVSEYHEDISFLFEIVWKGLAGR